MKSYFVTGGAGFVGSHLCEEIFFSNKSSKLIILDKLIHLIFTPIWGLLVDMT